MSEEGKRGARIFLQYSLLILVLAGFNLYRYFTGGGRMFLIAGIVCVAAFIGWIFFYVFYVRSENKPDKD